MQGCDDFQPFFGLIASTVARSRLRQERKSRDIQSSSDQSSSEEEDDRESEEDDREPEEDERESSLNSKSSASHDSRTKESERSEMLC